MSVTFEARLQQLLDLSDGKNCVKKKTLQDRPIIGNEIYVSNVNQLHGLCPIKVCITL